MKIGILIALLSLAGMCMVLISFVLGLGDAERVAPEAPQVQLDFEYDDTDEAATA